MSFNFETILQAHNGPIRCAEFSNNDNWLLTGDDEGNIKYFQTTPANLPSTGTQGTGDVHLVRAIGFETRDG